MITGVTPDNRLAAIVLAAGLGTRMRSRIPKVMHQFLGKPILVRVLETMQQIGADPLLAVVNHEVRQLLESLYKGSVVPILQEQQLGTGHATMCAAQKLRDFKGQALVVCGDTPLLSAATLLRLVEEHNRASGPLTLLTAKLGDPTGYGRIVRDGAGEILRVVEETECGENERAIAEVNTGVYCVDPVFLLRAVDGLSNENRQREFYLTEIVAIARGFGFRPHSVSAFESLEVRGVNTREELANMERELRLKINRDWMARGVSIEDPETTYIDPEVTIGQDTRVGPNTHLKGGTRIGKECRIDGNAYITRAEIGDRAWIHFSVVVTEACLEEGVELGPFAHLRPGTKIEKQAKVGNFVEVKNSSIGRGTKANHLSYIGDAAVGEQTNIGAGTITCNFDGFRKHRTVIGSRVQVGSDVQLVAPVEVGDDAYIGAGTTITKKVPSGALALSRVPQKLNEGWVERRRAREKQRGAAD